MRSTLHSLPAPQPPDPKTAIADSQIVDDGTLEEQNYMKEVVDDDGGILVTAQLCVTLTLTCFKVKVKVKVTKIYLVVIR
jgi:hypothetical protein